LQSHTGLYYSAEALKMAEGTLTASILSILVAYPLGSIFMRLTAPRLLDKVRIPYVYLRRTVIA
jgi:hypothetical protein